jgi:hypothetical protein
VGDIVIVVDDTLERNHWPRGRITKVYPGGDGQVRVVEVQTENGVYKRPAVKIAVLDLKVGVADDHDATPGGEMSSTDEKTASENLYS